MPRPSRAVLLAFVALAAAAAFVVLYGLEGTPMRPYDEGLYGRLARNALANDVWIHAVEADGTFSGKFSKPPLSLWLAAASMNALGPSMFSLRLPFALGMLFAIFVVTAWGTRAHGARLGLAWGATLTLCTATLRWGRYASIEPLFVGFGLAALWWHAEAMLATARRAAWWSLGAGLALTLAFLTKQLAVGLFVLPILVVDLVHRDLGRPGRVRRLALVLATPALLGGAWLWGAWRRAGEALVDIFFVQSVGGRIAGLDEGMNRRELDEVSTIVHDVVAPFPWVLGVVGLAAAWWWSRRSAASDGDETRGRTLLPTAMVALLLTASLLYDHVAATLLPWYVFAFVPPIAAGIAFVVDRAVDVRRDGPPWTWAVAATGVLALGVAVVGALGTWMPALDLAIGLGVLCLFTLRGALADPRRRTRAVVVGYVLVLIGTLRDVEFRQGPGALEQLMRQLGRRDVDVVAVDPNTGATREIEYVTYFGAGAVKVGAPPWRRALPGAQAFVTAEIPPSELKLPAGLELIRAPGAVAIVGDVAQSAFGPESTEAMLQAGSLTFEAEHLSSQRVETLRDDGDASGGRARAQVPFAGGPKGQFLLTGGPQWLLPPGRYTATFTLRWICPARGTKIARLWIVDRSQDVAKHDLDCEDGDRTAYDDVVVPFRLARPGRVELRIVYVAGEVWHDRTRVERTGA